jgi:hypothetical protein
MARGCDAQALKAVNLSNAQHSVAAFKSQANPADARWLRISARSFNRLRNVEEAIAILGKAVNSGEAHRSLVVPRLIAALDSAGFNEGARK